jgi:hypothetical protein
MEKRLEQRTYYNLEGDGVSEYWEKFIELLRRHNYLQGRRNQRNFKVEERKLFGRMRDEGLIRLEPAEFPKPILGDEGIRLAILSEFNPFSNMGVGQGREFHSKSTGEWAEYLEGR